MASPTPAATTRQLSARLGLRLSDHRRLRATYSRTYLHRGNGRHPRALERAELKRRGTVCADISSSDQGDNGHGEADRFIPIVRYNATLHSSAPTPQASLTRFGKQSRRSQRTGVRLKMLFGIFGQATTLLFGRIRLCRMARWLLCSVGYVGPTAK